MGLVCHSLQAGTAECLDSMASASAARSAALGRLGQRFPLFIELFQFSIDIRLFPG